MCATTTIDTHWWPVTDEEWDQLNRPKPADPHK